jgi:Tfp pilus assembly protein PilX
MMNCHRQLVFLQRHRQRGAATLIAVVFLYVAMAIIVVFANRNLIFEQKTSANQYRATMALEAAEAGLEWATTMLNKSGRITGACVDSASAGDSSFIDKYLSYVAASRTWTPAAAGTVIAACVTSQSGSDWTCSCPAAGTAPTATAPAAGGFKPGFSIAFITNTATRAVDLVSYGCTSVINSATCTGDAAATVRVTLASTSALATAPGAPLTARGEVNVGNAALGVQNGDPTSGGVTVNSGMGINATNLRITSTPGTPPTSTLIGNDASLRTTTEDQMFQTFFGVPKLTWRNSVADAILGPAGTAGVTRVCSPCTETDISAALAIDARKIWVEGDLAMNANLTLGAYNDAFLMVVNGSISMRGDLNVYGVLYSTAINWDNTGGGGALLSGAAISEGNYTGNGTPDYYYDPRVINNLREIPGPFVRLPGSWRDF